MGLRFRKHVSALPGNPDIVFVGPRVVVFCDGDFWHGRNWSSLSANLGRGTNPGYWVAKITANMERDARNVALLESEGWLVLRLWETDVKNNVTAAAAFVRDVVRQRKTRPLHRELSPKDK